MNSLVAETKPVDFRADKRFLAALLKKKKELHDEGVFLSLDLGQEAFK